MIILKSIYFVITSLFLLKIAIDLLTAYVLIWRLYNTESERTKGVSFMPIEILLLIIMIVLSIFIPGNNFYFEPLKIAGYGVLLVIFSYVHLALVGFIGGWIVSKLKKETK